METLTLNQTETLTEFETEMEEETGTLPLKQKLQDKSNNVLVIILLEKNVNFKNFIKPYELPICGKKMWEWVALAASGYRIKTTTCTNESDILSLIKPLLEDNYEYTAVLYSDTPLIKKSTLEEILDYATSRQMNALKLTRGFVFNTQYAKQATSIAVGQTEYFDEEDFLTAYDLKQLALVSDIMRHRILDFHMRNGIYIENPQSVQIDADVIIEPGTRIMAFNAIRGKTIIGKNCVIDTGNVIENSIISEGCIIKQSHVCESRISEFMTVGPFESVIKQST